MRVRYQQPEACGLLARLLLEVVGASPEAWDDAAVVCIGTDRSTGDSLGPLVGSHLARLVPRLRVYGTLEEPVHATNLGDTLVRLAARPPSFTLAVDACLGRAENVGSLTLRMGPLRPGTGVRKTLPEVGNAHIVGVVNVGGFMEYLVLQNTRLGVVWQMAQVIAGGIAQAAATAWSRQGAAGPELGPPCALPR
ncbi:MAG: spore protease YyaC [Limnochordaceae bacterium]|nr:spore protease YyaC [Limnochordaceae bacterium]